MSTVFLHHDPVWGHLVPAAAARASRFFLRAGPRPPDLTLWAMGRGWFRSLVLAIECLTVPGILLHYALRKRYMEEVARAHIAEGSRQVVILGAGYDTLAPRLHPEFPHVLFVEADHPATQRAKRGALEGRTRPGTNLKFLAVNLSRDRLEERLLALPEYDPRAACLFLAEGVLMYLHPDEVAGVFRSMRECTGPRSRFAFTFMEPRPDGTMEFRNSSRAVAAWLALRGERFTWGIRREHLAGYLQTRGFLLHEVATPDAFRARYLSRGRPADPPLADGEYLCVAGRA